MYNGNEVLISNGNETAYVFCVYTPTDHGANILDLSNWEFYVVPTFLIESDEKLSQQKTISLRSVQGLAEKKNFDTLCNAIKDACETINCRSRESLHSKSERRLAQPL